MAKNIIEINQLTKYYGKHKGIEEVTFSVEEGEIYGFIGPNGAGKSTTIRTLLALIHPTKGNATIFGKDCIQKAAEIAQDVGYLPAEASYYEQMTVKDLLEYSAALYGINCSTRMITLSDRLQLDLKRKISQLSLGNKKKVGIIQAILHSPKLLILDEPTSGLDPLMQQIFFDILKEEKTKGATILFSSHVLSEVQKICDKVAIIKEGHIIKEQKISELKNNGYKKIELTAKAQIPKNYFAEKDIANLKQEDCHVSFLFRGNINDILEKIWHLQVEDVAIEEPTLEEIFLHYYQ
ncbi:MAG: ABC transporter [Firmicutes bacterium HGW-Firmicutes-1]|jgi:ABC-2 type transport system ATP-binding protein|nr:MAG: ABC transporter [Firmicutes bacterium HGW-Firmicutes-1]